MRSLSLLQQEGETRLGGGGVGLVLHVLGRRAEHDVAEDGRADQHPLAHLRRRRQHDLGGQPRGELVEDQQLAPARVDPQAVVPVHGVDRIRAEAGGVDHPARLERASRGADAGDIRTHLDTLHPVLAQQGGAAVDGIRGESQRDRPGVDNALVGHRQAAGDARAQVRQLGVDLLGRDDPRLLVPVLDSLGLKGGKRGGLLLVPGHEDRSGPAHPDAGLLAVLPGQPVAACHQPALEGSRLGVVAGVQDGCVGL